MNKVILMFLVCFLLVTSVFAQDGNLNALVDGNNSFACKIYEQLSNEKPLGNLFFSPYSISTALAMTYVGARSNTAKQMKEVLGFNLDSNLLHQSYLQLSKTLGNVEGKNYQLEIANSLWAQEDCEFKKDFLKTIDDYYGGLFYKVDYKKNNEAVRLQINRWVEDKTHEKIRDLLSKGVLNELTRLVLVNAIYFKGKWAEFFNKTDTQAQDFFITSDKKVLVPLMNKTESFGYMENNDLQVLEMDYSGNDLSMVVILPKKNNSIADIEKMLKVENLENWLVNISTKKVEVFLPKFRLEQQFSLGENLKSLGISDAFDPELADFYAMTVKKEDKLYISAVIHKAFVDVEEEGTEAAAATAVVMMRATASPFMNNDPIPVFRADHPFIFLIRDKRTSSILFMGKMMDPSI